VKQVRGSRQYICQRKQAIQMVSEVGCSVKRTEQNMASSVEEWRKKFETAKESVEETGKWMKKI